MGARAIRADKAIVVTTFGFTKDAEIMAEESDGKIVLLTEAQLLQEIPPKHRERYTSLLAESHYLTNYLSRISFPKVYYERFLQRLSKIDVARLLSESMSSQELTKILLEHISKEKLAAELVRVLEPKEIAEILRTLPIPEKLDERKKNIEEKYRKAQSSTDANEKGRMLESIVKEIIELVPGLKVTASNVDTGIEEVDIQIRNHNREHVWAEFEGMIFAECKNWSKPVDSAEVDHFVSELKRHNIHIGILVATKGVTGSPHQKTGAAWAIKMSLQEGFKVVVVDGNDLEEILKCKDVSTTVDEEYAKLYQ